MALQKQLRGLADFLGLYELGNVKAEYGGVVAPTLDVSNFLTPPQWYGVQLAASALDAGASILLDADQQHDLFFLSYHGGPVNGGTTAIDISCGVTVPQASAQVDLYPKFDTRVSPPNAGDLIGGMVQFPRPLPLPPGTTSLRFYVRHYAGAGSTNVACAALLRSYKI